MKRIRRKGGQRVQKGNYWNFVSGERVALESEGILPGNKDTIYYKFPPVVILIAGPVLGLVYALFLPLIGLGMLAKVISGHLSKGAMRKLMNAMVFSWRPHESYLDGKRRKH